jgi:hypothetical protein
MARAAAPMFSGLRERTSTTRSRSNHGGTVSDADGFSRRASLYLLAVSGAGYSGCLSLFEVWRFTS